MLPPPFSSSIQLAPRSQSQRWSKTAASEALSGLERAENGLGAETTPGMELTETKQKVSLFPMEQPVSFHIIQKLSNIFYLFKK